MDKTDFEQVAAQKPLTMPAEFCLFLKENKKWWLLPIVAFLLVFGLLAAFAGTAAAPFIYTLF
jgi:drug/metabolite transporter superfamily protein YnfA